MVDVSRNDVIGVIQCASKKRHSLAFSSRTTRRRAKGAGGQRLTEIDVG